MEPELLAGRYELVAPVGKGATGQVWQGFDKVLRRGVAIKLVELESTRDPAMAERFSREGVAIAGLSHNSIVKVFDTGTDAHRGWLVMELLSGPDFNALVRQTGPLRYEVGMPLLAKVADGLQSAHDAGITHRDVKPANIVLDAPLAGDGARPDLMARPELGRPVLVDFGIARIVDEAGAQLTRPATAIGTAAYMSPEQARGFAAGPASDVYSLGCVVHYLFVGRPPFLADSSVAVARAQAFDTPVPLGELSPDAPPALDALVTRMLAKDPKVRPSAREVATELRAITANPLMAPTVLLAGPATEAMAGAAPTMVMDAAALAATGLQPVPPAPQPTPPAAPLVPIAAEDPFPGQLDPRADTGGGFRNAGRWLVVLLILALAGGLAYTWFSRQPLPPTPGETVTMTMTQPPTTSTSPPTRAPQTQSSPPPTSQPPTSQPPAPPPTEPSVPKPTETTAPPVTTQAPPTSAAPPTTEEKNPPPTATSS